MENEKMVMKCKFVDYVNGTTKEATYQVTEEQMKRVAGILDDLCEQCEDSPNNMMYVEELGE